MASKSMLLAACVGVAGAAYAFRTDIAPILPKPIASAFGLPEAGSAPDKSGASANSAATGGAPAKQASQKGPSAKGGTPPVTIATARIADMPIVLAAPGTVEALATVALKPRVDGQVVEVGFKEGDLVQAGSVLYRLDDRLVRAQIKQVEATILRDEASLKDALSIASRREELFQKRYASEAATETAKQNVEVLRASIAAGQAQLEMQKTQLDYLVIRAPITGRTGSMTAKLGAFVRSADPVALVTINQTKPIAVSFALPQVNLEVVKQALGRQARARVLLPRQAGAKADFVEGTLTFVDNQIDKTTGTVTAKVTVENADETLWPGQAVNVELTVEVRSGVVAVPASAIRPAQQGMITWVLGGDNKVSVRPVVQDRVIGQTAFVTSGLQPGDKVVTDGQLRLVPGGSVSVREEGRAKGPPAEKDGKARQAPPGAGGG